MCLFFFSYYSFFCWPFLFLKKRPIHFNFLLVQYGIAVNYVGVNANATWTTNGYNNIYMNPIYIIRSGNFNSGSFDYQASDGNLWSGTTISGINAYDLNYSSSTVSTANRNNRQRGYPVRCIAHYFWFFRFRLPTSRARYY